MSNVRVSIMRTDPFFDPFSYFAPITTPLTSPAAGGPLTVYFRTHIEFTNVGVVLSLTASNYVDDGAVWYLNGTEAGRLRMAAGAVAFSTLAQNVTQEGLVGVLNFPPAALLAGDNVMAAEVHQSTATSSDIVFGMSLDATVTRTNQPVILNPLWPGNGDFQGTLSGIAGRKYSVDVATTLSGPWTSLTNFSPFGGSATFLYPAAGPGPRFYRGRLVP